MSLQAAAKDRGALMATTVRTSITLVLSAFVALAAILVLSGNTAGAQDGDATIDVTVRYPNGQLVTDTELCLGLAVPFDGSFRTFETIQFSGPHASFSAQSGGLYAVSAQACPTQQIQLVPVFHNGIPAAFVVDRNAQAAMISQLRRDAIYAKPGSNEVTVTVGLSPTAISGRVTGPSASRCAVHIWGRPLGSSYFGPMAYPRVLEDGTYEAILPPGTYTVETQCFLRSAYEAWPNVEAIADASTITLGSGTVRTNIDFDITDRFDETVGAFLSLRLSEVDATHATPKCLESYDLNGKLIRRAVGGASVGAPTNGSYRVLVRDCFGMGFNNVWYPNAATPQAAETIVVDGTIIELSLPGVVPLTGPDFNTCGEEEVTIRGTRGRDVIRGTSDRDVISTFAGNDIIHGLSGDDVICAGDGNDRVFGNAGDDWIHAGAGADWVGAGWGEDTVYGGAGNDFIRGFKHDDFVDGGTGNDRITGGWGNDVLRGGPGNDTLRAYFGADRLFGDAGNDALVAGNGPDFLVGGPGPADRLFGDQGRDTCNDVGADTQFVDCEKQNEPA